MENNYSKKEKIIEELKQLLESQEDPSLAYSRAKFIAKKWGKVREDEESFYDKELADQFNDCMNKLAEKAGDIAVNTEERKLDIIERAKQAAEDSNFKKATDKMNELMEEWKHSGRINEEKDNELWSQFSEIRKNFFEKRADYYKNLKESYATNKQSKLDLIEKAKEILNMENISEAQKANNDLMDDWKKIGSAGYKEDDSLWNEFLTHRKAFYEKRDEYYDGMKKEFAKKYEEKKELLAQAKIYLARSEFTKEEVEAVKELRNKWKEIGNAGRDNENKIYPEFNEIINKYFQNKRDYENDEE